MQNFERLGNKPFTGLLLACYELGHQPLSLAWPLAAIKEAGFSVDGVDLSVDPFPEELASEATFVGVAVPMHTALRLGVRVAGRVRKLNPQAHICFYGLYAWLNAGYLLEERIADSVIGGEYENPLLDLLKVTASGSTPEAVAGVMTATKPAEPYLGRVRFPVPRRDTLAPLTAYARFEKNGHTHLAGYTEASRGCLHTCRHCPVVPVYKGRFFAVPMEAVLADIRQQVEAGAAHITFGDPDFLNGPTHALRVARSVHAEFPEITFDFTTKVEHILKYRHVLPELRALGGAFVVSAFESTSDVVLGKLDKGHTFADMEEALEILGKARLPIQPTWVPFTPWSTLEDYLALLSWIRKHDLIPNVSAVQLSIRLLVPPQSALLWDPEVGRVFGPLDPENFTHRWEHLDPRMDSLQGEVAAIAEVAWNEDPYRTFAEIEHLAYGTAGQSTPVWETPSKTLASPPRLTEDWFC